MRLILVRHGDAHAGLHGVIGGPRGCAGLTDKGRHQAVLLRDHLRRSGHVQADVLMASMLPRAIETARIIAPGLGFDSFAQDCDLCEVHTGEADGLGWTEYTERFGSLDMLAEPDRVFAPGGESWNSFHERVERTLERLAREHVDRTVVAVCHAGVIMASIRAIFDVPHPGTGARLQPTNTGLTEWEYDPPTDRWTLHTFNDTSHLDGMANG
jgi:probable phosphoglycerate mutase